MSKKKTEKTLKQISLSQSFSRKTISTKTTKSNLIDDGTCSLLCSLKDLEEQVIEGSGFHFSEYKHVDIEEIINTWKESLVQDNKNPTNQLKIYDISVSEKSYIKKLLEDSIKLCQIFPVYSDRCKENFKLLNAHSNTFTYICFSCYSVPICLVRTHISEETEHRTQLLSSIEGRHISLPELPGDAYTNSMLSDDRKGVFSEENIDEPNFSDSSRELYDKLQNIRCAHHLVNDNIYLQCLEKRSYPSPDLPSTVQRIMINFKKLSLAHGIEPIFGSISLHNIKTKSKISETFHFDTLTNEMSDMLPSSIRSLRKESKYNLKSCILSYDQCITSNAYIIIHIEKFLEKGELNKCLAFYEKEKHDEKTFSKQQAKCSKIKQTEVAYLMPIGWVAISIQSIISGTAGYFSNCSITSVPSSSASSSNVQGTKAESSPTSQLGRSTSDCNKCCLDDRQLVQISSFFRQEPEKLSFENIYKMISEIDSGQSSSKKHRNLCGDLSFEVSQIEDGIVENTLDSNFNKITHDFDNGNKKKIKNQGFTYVVEDFPTDLSARPYFSPINILYFKPVSLNLNQRSSLIKNCSLTVILYESEKKSPLNAIFSRWAHGYKSWSESTVVTYRNKFPLFYEEIRIDLPLVLSESFHLFFIVKSVVMNQQTGSSHSDYAYSWLLLFNDGRLVNGKYSLPMSLEQPQPGYSSSSSNTSELTLKWIDNKKNILDFEISCKSSIYTSNPNLLGPICSSIPEKCLPKSFSFEKNQTQSRVSTFNGAGTEVGSNSLLALETISLNEMVSFLHVIVNRLLSCIVLPRCENEQSYDEISPVFSIFKVLVNIVHRIATNYTNKNDPVGRNSYLGTYTKYILNPAEITKDEFNKDSQSDDSGISHKSTIHESIITLWIFANSSIECFSKIIESPWFFFETIYKSIISHISLNAIFNKPRSKRMEQTLETKLNMLMSRIAETVCSKMKQNSKVDYSHLHTSLAYFLSDLAYIYDRGIILNFIHIYFDKLQEIGKLGFHAKFTIISIFLTNENISFIDIPLLFSTKDKTKFQELSVSSFDLGYLKKYSVIPAFINEIIQCYRICGHSEAFEFGINCLIFYLKAAEFSNSKIINSKSSVNNETRTTFLNHLSLVLFPFVTFIVDSGSFVKKINVDKSKESIIDSQQLLLSNSLDSLKNKSDKDNDKKKEPLNREIFFIILWIIRNSDYDFIIYTWKTWECKSRLGFLEILFSSLKVFKEQDIVQNESFNSPENSSRTKKLESLRDSILHGTARKGFHYKTTTLKNGEYREYRSHIISSKKLPISESSSSLLPFSEKELRTLTSRTVNCMVHNLTQIIESTPENQELFIKSLAIIIRILSSKQSIAVHSETMITLLFTLEKYQLILFSRSSLICGNLSSSLVFLCKSSVDVITVNSINLLYRMIKMNSNTKGNIKRMLNLIKMGIFSGIDAENVNPLFYQNSISSLSKLLLLAQKDSRQKLHEPIAEMVSDVEAVLVEISRIKDMKDDIYQRVDVIYKIINLFSQSPDLKIFWILKLEAILTNNCRFLEAGLCWIAAVVIISEYLLSNGESDFLESPHVLVKPLNLHFLDDFLSLISDNLLGNDLTMNQEVFSVKGLIKMFNKAIITFSRVSNDAFIWPIFDILGRIYMKTGPFKDAVKMFEKINYSLDKMSKKKVSSSENSYFRVSFFGNSFKNMNNMEFVYCEAPHTKLNEFAAKLENIYTKIHGSANFSILKDSSNFENTSADPDKLYVQITFVEPYLEEWEIYDVRDSPLKDQNIRRFFYESPYTKGGQSRGSLIEQYKRRTVLTTNGFFPNIRLRLEVVKKIEMDLMPIEVVIDDIKRRVSDIRNILEVSPLDSKLLQLNLQGCIGTSVNQGPFMAVKAFILPFLEDRLDSVSDSNEFEDLLYLRNVNKLQLICDQMLKICEQAVGGIEKSSDIDALYKDTMKEFYYTLVDQITPLLVKTRNKMSCIFSD